MEVTDISGKGSLRGHLILAKMVIDAIEKHKEVNLIVYLFLFKVLDLVMYLCVWYK